MRVLLESGEAFPGRECLVRRTPNAGLGARLALAAPRAFGSATERNRFRRLAREAFRRVRSSLGDHDFHLSPRKGLETPTFAGILADLLRTKVERPAPPRPAARRPERRRR
jgi:ribonuclease P protein component